jgi:uncharacterized protein YeaO (DUF488 family)
MKAVIKTRRIYDPPLKEDGTRILADRLWPRGMKKEAAALAEWAKELAPSTALRNWFHQDPGRWEEFRQRYLAELVQNKEVAAFTTRHADKKVITLL